VILAITVFLAPAAVVFGRLNPLNLTLGLNGWSALLYMGLVCTVIPMVLYFRGLRWISSSESGTLQLLEVLSGLVLAVSLLRQVPNVFELIAATAIVAALAIGNIFK